jgi:hypothetical protein
LAEERVVSWFEGGHTVVLRSQREGVPYADRVEEDGRVLIYEGHDIGKESLDPKSVDQPETNPDGSLTQNVLFLEAAAKYKRGEREPGVVKVYEKIRPGIWAYNGLFKLMRGKRNPADDTCSSSSWSYWAGTTSHLLDQF